MCWLRIQRLEGSRFCSRRTLWDFNRLWSENYWKAEELQPGLIMLDIGLPELNGIEAARRIRKVSPESKILFVTQESSPEVVQECFRLARWAM